ncbi:hypothetical protein [Streptomyces adustus]
MATAAPPDEEHPEITRPTVHRVRTHPLLSARPYPRHLGRCPPRHSGGVA